MIFFRSLHNHNPSVRFWRTPPLEIRGGVSYSVFVGILYQLTIIKIVITVDEKQQQWFKVLLLKRFSMQNSYQFREFGALELT